MVDPGDHVDQGGFPASRTPHHAYQVALVNVNIYAFQHGRLTGSRFKSLGNPLQADDWAALEIIPDGHFEAVSYHQP
jgi:hypothetical protein